jgi:hypothetical protein
MNAQSVGITVAAAVDQTLVGASKIMSTVEEAAQSFSTAFTGELERRRGERAALQPAVSIASPF